MKFLLSALLLLNIRSMSIAASIAQLLPKICQTPKICGIRRFQFLLRLKTFKLKKFCNDLPQPHQFQRGMTSSGHSVECCFDVIPLWNWLFSVPIPKAMRFARDLFSKKTGKPHHFGYTWTVTMLVYLSSWVTLFTLTTLLILLPFNPTAQALRKGQPLPSDLFIRLNEQINPTVVNISTTSRPKLQRQRPRQYRDPFFDMFEQFLNPYGPRQQRPQQSLGTGFIIRKDGLIITNNHVIDKADLINVTLSNSKEVYTAKVIGKDRRTDTALIKITAKKTYPL